MLFMIYYTCCVLKIVKGEFMTKEKNIEKYLWITAVMFITYLLLGSFVTSKDLTELAYLVLLYVTMVFIKIKK